MYAIAEKVGPWTKRVIQSLTPHCSRLQTSLRKPTSNCEMCTSSIAPVSRRRMCWRTIENADVLYDYHFLSTGNPEAIAILFGEITLIWKDYRKSRLSVIRYSLSRRDPSTYTLVRIRESDLGWTRIGCPSIRIDLDAKLLNREL